MSTSNNSNSEEWQGLLLGTAAGALAGVISGMSTKRKKFIINGSIEKWKRVRLQLSMMSKKDILMPPPGILAY